MDSDDALIRSRLQKLETLRQQGIAPYARRFPKPQSIQALLADFHEGRAVSAAGRLAAKRQHGRSSFADLRDLTGRIQLLLKQDLVGEPAYQLFDTLDLGDVVGVAGTLVTTKTGERTIQVQSLELLAKSLRPLPEKWHGLKDTEARYRRRYLDLAANQDAGHVFVQRSRLVREIRSLLDQRGFLEVETPMMQPMAGGAAGEPFVTHHKALDIDLHLRLAPELYLKRLLVGGFDKIYEVNRCFRNEGLSPRHNPEFTMLEAYASYEDCAYVMQLTQDIIAHAAQQLCGSPRVTYQGQTIDFTPPWPRFSFAGHLEREYGIRPDDGVDALWAAVRRIRKLPEAKGPISRSQVVRLVEELIEPQTQGPPGSAEKGGRTGAPIFVVDYWTELSPLAKSLPDRPLIADRFELYIAGMEIANGYSELNDPIEQRRRFEQQLAAGEQPAGRPRTIDEDFVEALEYGMPPAGGLGIGIDRLAMLLTNQPSIKDVILFPQQKPEA